jgi:amino acid adenylation domain-containing protein
MTDATLRPARFVDIAGRIERVFALDAARPAICISGVTHTYAELRDRVAAIHSLLDLTAEADERLIGVVVTDTLDTYASVLAVLRSGRAFVPLNLDHPAERNASVVTQAGLRTVIVSHENLTLSDDVSQGARHLHTPSASHVSTSHVAVVTPDELAYLLFTSGSTGEPKGVPITRGNLSAFLDALAAAGGAMHEHDRVLQMFDLTFDFSIATYLAPLSNGACIYTVPSGTVKFAEVYRLLAEEGLTVAPMVPSVLNYLRPYFDDISLPELRLSFFCGEALHADVADAWARCAPRSAIVNFYGPTEATVFAMNYEWLPAEGKNKTLNGVVSIGHPMRGTAALLVDDELQFVPPGKQGELCLAGLQLTPGYWNDPARNARAFFEREVEGRLMHFYHTGDMAIRDADGDYLFCGRVDHQVKLQGYRVELGEIERHVRELLPGYTCVVVPYTNQAGNVELRLVVERHANDLRPVLASLRARVPSYMVPARAMSVTQIPLNANGKIDRRAIQGQLEAELGADRA